MIKQMLQYKDIDGKDTTQTVMFNLTMFEVEGEMELEVIQDRFQKFQDEVIGNDPNAPLREMTGPEKREIMGMIKTLVRHSYGIRDGKHFRKSDEIWSDFEDTGAFSAFLYWLFEKPERANAFMAGIWPQGIDRPEDQPRPDLKVVGEMEVIQGEVVENEDDTTPSIDAPAATDTTTAGNSTENEWNMFNFTRDQLLDMSDEDYEKVKQANTQGRNVPLTLLQIDGQRKSRGEG